MEMNDDLELEDDEVQGEVEKVIAEIMSGKVKSPAQAASLAPEASIDLPEPSKEELAPEPEEEEAEVEDDLEEMQSRLQALRS